MPSSLIIGALVLAWLVVLVPMIARKRQEVVRTADTALAARVVPRAASGSERPGHDSPASKRARLEEYAVPDDEHLEDGPAETPRAAAPPADAELTAELPLPEDGFAGAVPDGDDPELDEAPHADEYGCRSGAAPLPPGDPGYVTRPYRPGRGGYDAEAAELAAAAKYALRRRVVLALLVATVAALVLGAAVAPQGYWAAAGLAAALAGYLTYLRRQVRIENDIRHRRGARMRPAPPVPARVPEPEGAEPPEEPPADEPARPSAPAAPVRPGATVVDHDDGDPAFDELDDPDVLPYRRAAGQ